MGRQPAAPATVMNALLVPSGFWVQTQQGTVLKVSKKIESVYIDSFKKIFNQGYAYSF